MLFVANIRGFLVFRGEYPSCAKTLTGFTCFKLIYHMALTLEILELFFDRNICVCVFDRNHTFETDEVWIDLQIIRKDFCHEEFLKFWKPLFLNFNCSFSFKKVLVVLSHEMFLGTWWIHLKVLCV